LLNATIFATSGAPKRGQTFTRLQVIRGRGTAAIVLGTIAQGYITANQDRAWPGSPIEGSTEGDGYLRAVTGTDPAAGAQILETVPTGARWELVAFSGTLTTDGTAATRRPVLLLDNGTIRYMRSANPATLAASDTQLFYWGQGLTLDTLVASGSNQAGLLTNAALLAGHRVLTILDSGQAGDNWGAPLLTVREWLEVP